MAQNKKNECSPMSFEYWTKDNIQPRIGDDSCYSEDENGQYYWGLHKKYKAYLKDWENQNFGPDPSGLGHLSMKQMVEKVRFVSDDKDMWREHLPSSEEENKYIENNGIQNYVNR